MNGAWTPDKEGMLKILWAQGKTCSQIAKQLGGGLSRSAIIGKVHRLGLPMRAKVSAHRSGKKHVHYAPAKKVAQLAPKLKAEPLDKTRAPKRGPNAVRWIDHTSDQCEMFCAGEEGAQGFVCGEPSVFPGNWCTGCRSVVYLPPEPRRRAA